MLGIKGITKVFVLTLLFFFVFSLAGGYLPLSGNGAWGVTKAEASGTQQLGDLEIGDKVVDKSWEWEHRTGDDYSDTGETKPVTWIVVAKDHYGEGSGVTLLSEELIGRHAFDNSTHISNWGYNHWGESGTHASADRGLRPWLNSTGIHDEAGFYRTFSPFFKNAIVEITLPNKHWEEGETYNTKDKVFIPSTTELGDITHSYTYEIGTVYEHFIGATDGIRIAQLGGSDWWYWTRSPHLQYSGRDLRYVKDEGGFGNGSAADGDKVCSGVRPALNLSSDIFVTAAQNDDDAYEIIHPASDADLSDLSVNPGTLDPDFDPGTIAYTVDVAHDIDSIDVTATLSDPSASMGCGGCQSWANQAYCVICCQQE